MLEFVTILLPLRSSNHSPTNGYLNAHNTPTKPSQHATNKY